MSDDIKKTPPADPPKPETFSREYVQELREENKAWRLKHSESETTRAALAEKAKKATDEAQAKVEEATTKAEQRIIRAELKAEALKAGMIDLDGLKLANLSTVKIDEKGEVTGGEELMKKLKESKPYLFKPASTSNPADPPKPNDPKAKNASEMTADEYAAARKKIR